MSQQNKLDYADFQITAKYNTEHFHCKDGKKVPAEYICNIIYISQQLQVLSQLLGNCTLSVVNGYVSHQYASKLAYYNELYSKGRAVTISSQKYTPMQLYNKILEAINHDYIPDGQILLISGGVHYAPRLTQRHLKIYVDIPFNSSTDLL